MSKLYSKSDTVVLPTQKEKIDQLPVTVEKPDNQELLANIKDIFEQNKVKTSNKIYFTTKSGTVTYNIDKTELTPPSVVLMSGGKFKEAYAKYLDGIIFSKDAEINTDKLLSIIVLYSYINKNVLPIKLTSGKLIKLLPQIAVSLNDFFNKNNYVIYSIYTSFNSMKDTENEDTKSLTSKKESPDARSTTT